MARTELGNGANSGDTRRVAAIVLAAGDSRRMGKANKLLAKFSGTPLIRHVVERVLLSDVCHVAVVTGHESADVSNTLRDLAVETVYNGDYVQGMGGSVACGVQSLSYDIEGALICLGDMPWVGPQAINEIIACLDPENGADICVPVFKGQRGNPVLWGRRFFPELSALVGKTGGRQLLARFADHVREIETASRGVLMDIDTPEDFAGKPNPRMP